MSEKHDGSFTVVLLDDNETFLNELHNFLVRQRPHWSVIKTTDSAECLATCHDVLVDAVVIDEELVGDTMQGHEVLKKLSDEKRTHGAAVPILVTLTGIYQKSDAFSRGRALGDAFFEKATFAEEPEVLLQRIEEVYRRDVPGGAKRL